MTHPAAGPGTAELIRGRASVGDFELTVSATALLARRRRDVRRRPQTLWQKRTRADAKNRVLHWPEYGRGSYRKPHRRHRNRHRQQARRQTATRSIRTKQQLRRASLAAAGIRPEDVDIVINTHLHFDHCGWNTTRTPKGYIMPTFPNARYYAHRGEVEHGHLQLERDGVSYISTNYDPLVDSGQMTLLEMPARRSGRHRPWHHRSSVSRDIPRNARRPHRIRRASAPATSATCIPTSAHLDITWVMGYDLDPIRCIAERKRFYERAIPEEWLVLFTHDHHTPFARLKLNDKGKPVLKDR